jgi:hypothetical protein
VPLEAELDEAIGGIVIVDRSQLRSRPRELPVEQQLVVHRADRVAVEAVAQRMPEPVQPEVPAAPCIGAVQERTVFAARGHAVSVIGTRAARA